MNLTNTAGTIIATNPVIKSALNNLKKTGADKINLYVGDFMLISIHNPNHCPKASDKRTLKKVGIL